MFIERLFDDPVTYLSVVVVVMFSIVLHELGHGAAALWEGDQTPLETGHMDLNPMTHMGGMAIAALVLFGISWGAMPVRPQRFRHGRKGAALVAFAGPAVNLILLVAFALLYVLWAYWAGSMVGNANLQKNLGEFFFLGALFNGALFLLNMVPVPPLDGYTVLTSLSDSFARLAEPLRQYGMMIFLVIFMFGGSFLFSGASAMASATIFVFTSLLT